MWWTNLLYVLLGVLIGGVAGFFITRKIFSEVYNNMLFQEKNRIRLFLMENRKKH